jgi:hypothetical protein
MDKPVLPRIYLSPPHMSGEELELVQDAFAGNWIAPLGPHVDAFEREAAEYIGVSHAAALVSGTTAIHLALRLIGLQPGDEVLCSTLTFSASANPVLYEHAQPAFIDCGAASWNIDPALLREELDAMRPARSAAGTTLSRRASRALIRPGLPVRFRHALHRACARPAHRREGRELEPVLMHPRTLFTIEPGHGGSQVNAAQYLRKP